MRTETLGKFTLKQAQGVFPLGADSVNLAAFATLRPGYAVCDLGCGSGVLGLLLLEREERLMLTGVDSNPQAIALAQENFADNGQAVDLHCCDITQIPLPAGRFDLVIANPPFFAQGSGGDGGGARMERTATLEDWCRVAARLLRNGGRFALCHRPARLPELFGALTQVGLTPKVMQLVQHNPDKPPSLVLVEAVRQGSPDLQVRPTLMRT